ncbi:MAG: alpha/beta hydrolase [Pseudomonadota bacterium]
MEYDDAYANGPYIPNAADFPDKWADQAKEFRELEAACGRALLNQPYGDGQAYDYFTPSARPTGTMVFVHGGYWKAFDRKSWSHFATGAMDRDWAVAMVGYPLAPAVRIADITRAVRAAVVQIACATHGPITLVGHSAGGHLVARLVMPDMALPADIAVRLAHVMCISPVGDLRDLQHTQMNAVLHITADEARGESPTLGVKHLPTPMTVWVGADERPKFLQQARDLAHAWDVPLVIQPDRHHFDVLDDLQQAHSPMVAHLTGGQP